MQPEFDRILEGMKEEFLQDTREKLIALEELLNRIASGAADFVPLIQDINILVHSIKGNAGSFGFPAITHIAHALEDYLTTIAEDTAFPVEGMGCYLRQISDIVEQGENPAEAETTRIIKNLPAHAGAGADSRSSHPQAILHMPDRVWFNIMAGELSRLGVKVAAAATPLEAIDRGVTLQPDLLVTGHKLDRMTGVELAAVFAVLNSTEKTRVVILASEPQAHLDGLDCPANTFFLEKGPSYRDGLEKRLMPLLS